jgi:GNAT superfamily N-acetyltransferase
MTSVRSPHVVLVQCTGQKREGTHRARDLYDESTYFCKQRGYAETADQWYIQSAKYGLVHPDDVIDSYDCRADELDDPDAWAREIVTDLSTAIPADATLDVLGGRAYVDPLRPYLDELDVAVREPLQGQGIGQRMATLDAMRSERTE